MKSKLKLTRWALLGVALLTAHTAVAAEGWLTDFMQAQKQAEATERPILVNFSGSDWCGWCIRLDTEVLEKAEFKEYAKDNLVLFVADFPRQTKLPEQTATQNQTLLERYGVQGFPTLLLVDAKGDVIGRTGYQPGGAEAYVTHLRELLENRPEPAAATPKPWEYDAENDRYWHPGHGHWHRGKPPEEG